MGSTNMRDIKRRIKSIESTMQITKAMELVSSSKLRRAKERADNARPFFEAIYQTMAEICSEDNSIESIFKTQKIIGKRVLIISIAGDRGLAGGFNSNIIKLTQAKIEEHNANNKEVLVMPIGNKAVEYFEKQEIEILESYENIAEGITIYKAFAIADMIIEEFKAGHIDKVELVFTNYVSPLVQEARHMEILPLKNVTYDRNIKRSATLYEPSIEFVFNRLVPRYLSGILFGAIVDSFASEQATRRTAMESATENAKKMIDSLSLIYNRARQATITAEITEIVGGANAIE